MVLALFVEASTSVLASSEVERSPSPPPPWRPPAGESPPLRIPSLGILLLATVAASRADAPLDALAVVTDVVVATIVGQAQEVLGSFRILQTKTCILSKCEFLLFPEDRQDFEKICFSLETSLNPFQS